MPQLYYPDRAGRGVAGFLQSPITAGPDPGPGPGEIDDPLDPPGDPDPEDEFDVIDEVTAIWDNIFLEHDFGGSPERFEVFCNGEPCYPMKLNPRDGLHVSYITVGPDTECSIEIMGPNGLIKLAPVRTRKKPTRPLLSNRIDVSAVEDWSSIPNNLQDTEVVFDPNKIFRNVPYKVCSGWQNCSIIGNGSTLRGSSSHSIESGWTHLGDDIYKRTNNDPNVTWMYFVDFGMVQSVKNCNSDDEAMQVPNDTFWATSDDHQTWYVRIKRGDDRNPTNTPRVIMSQRAGIYLHNCDGVYYDGLNLADYGIATDIIDNPFPNENRALRISSRNVSVTNATISAVRGKRSHD